MLPAFLRTIILDGLAVSRQSKVVQSLRALPYTTSSAMMPDAPAINHDTEVNPSTKMESHQIGSTESYIDPVEEKKAMRKFDVGFSLSSSLCL